MNISIYYIKPIQNCRICCALVDQPTDTECFGEACLWKYYSNTQYRSSVLF